jgi:hypothetical protein
MVGERQASGTARAVLTWAGWLRNWQDWSPYAAVAWGLAYAVLVAYWAVSGRGFPYTPDPVSDVTGPVVERFGPGVAWTVVILTGIPASAVGAAMLRGMRSRALRPLFISTGTLLGGVLLLLMTDVTLLIVLGYTPYGIVTLFTGAEFGKVYLGLLTQWTTAHQLLCIIGGFLWLAATLSYARRSGDACLYCGRRDGPEGWTSPKNAASRGRIAVYVSMVAPVLYAITRYAYALGIPLGISEELLRLRQGNGMWTQGHSMATFGLVGAVLTLGLTQRWGEVFPRWMIGLAGRRVPIGLAIVPASFVPVLLVVGSIAMWSGFAQLVGKSLTGEAEAIDIVGLAPTMLFIVWGAALAVATLGYYYRRRGPCEMCGRGAPGQDGP